MKSRRKRKLSATHKHRYSYWAIGISLIIVSAVVVATISRISAFSALYDAGSEGVISPSLDSKYMIGGLEIQSPALDNSLRNIVHPFTTGSAASVDRLVVSNQNSSINLRIKIKPTLSASTPGGSGYHPGWKTYYERYQELNIDQLPRLGLYSTKDNYSCYTNPNGTRSRTMVVSDYISGADLTLVKQIDQYTADYKLTLNNTVKGQIKSLLADDFRRPQNFRDLLYLRVGPIVQDRQILDAVTWEGGSNPYYNYPVCSQTLRSNVSNWGELGPSNGLVLLNQSNIDAIHQTQTRVETVSISPNQITLRPGAKTQFTYQAKDMFNRPAVVNNVTWSVRDKVIGTITQSGLFTAALPLSPQYSPDYYNVRPTNFLNAVTISVNNGFRQVSASVQLKGTPINPPPTQNPPVLTGYRINQGGYGLELVGTKLNLNSSGMAPEPGSKITVRYKNGASKQFTDTQFFGTSTSLNLYVSRLDELKNISSITLSVPNRGNATTSKIL